MSDTSDGVDHAHSTLALSDDPRSESQKSRIYKASVLGRWEIRIIQVEPSEDYDELLSCKLQIASLYPVRSHEYEAISYCWSEHEGYERIRMNDVVVYAPASAVNVVRRFRYKSRTRTLWIDALCINQDDPKERARQVTHMSRIYHHASNCLIWLGRNDEIDSEVINSMQYISDVMFKQYCEARDQFKRDKPADLIYDYSPARLFGDRISSRNVFEFFMQPWFRRLWVFQEAVLPAKAVCHYGEREIALDDLGRAAVWIPSNLDFFPGFGRHNEAWSGLGFAVFIWSHRMRHHLHLEEKVSLRQILGITHIFQTSDDRDRLYGILGVLKPRLDSIVELEWLKVDYTKSVEEVFCDATRAVIMQDKSLSTLRQTDLIPLEQRIIQSNNTCSWLYPIAEAHISEYTTRHEISPVDRDEDCAPGPMYLELLRPGGYTQLLYLEGYNVSRVAKILTNETYTKHGRMRGHLGKIVHEALEHLTSLGRLSLVKNMLLAMRQASFNSPFPDLDSDGDWDEFARRFGDFCFECDQSRTDFAGSKILPSEPDAYLKSMYQSAILSCCDRRLFITSNGHIGLGPGDIQESDIVAALFGSDHPTILRPATKNHTQSAMPHLTGVEFFDLSGYRFVGLAAIPAIMKGEAIREFKDAGVNAEVFCIW